MKITKRLLRRLILEEVAAELRAQRGLGRPYDPNLPGGSDWRWAEKLIRRGKVDYIYSTGRGSEYVFTLGPHGHGYSMRNRSDNPGSSGNETGQQPAFQTFFLSHTGMTQWQGDVNRAEEAFTRWRLKHETIALFPAKVVRLDVANSDLGYWSVPSKGKFEHILKWALNTPQVAPKSYYATDCAQDVFEQAGLIGQHLTDEDLRSGPKLTFWDGDGDLEDGDLYVVAQPTIPGPLGPSCPDFNNKFIIWRKIPASEWSPVPKVGLYPVELWPDWQPAHDGTQIAYVEKIK